MLTLLTLLLSTYVDANINIIITHVREQGHNCYYYE